MIFFDDRHSRYSLIRFDTRDILFTCAWIIKYARNAKDSGAKTVFRRRPNRRIVAARSDSCYVWIKSYFFNNAYYTNLSVQLFDSNTRNNLIAFKAPLASASFIRLKSWIKNVYQLSASVQNRSYKYLNQFDTADITLHVLWVSTWL